MNKLIILIFVLVQLTISKRLYTNKWVVHIRGEPEDVARIVNNHGFLSNGEIYENVYRLKKIGLPQKSTKPSDLITSRLLRENQVLSANQIIWKRIIPRADFNVNDRLWPDMWYLQKNTHPSMKIIEAWEAGYTGRGVTVGIVDNGVDINHPDLKPNIINGLNYDFMDNDLDPSPSESSQNHGTLCAGVVSAVCNNSLCGCGLAFDGSLAGIKNNDGGTYSDIEARSLLHKMDDISIYSNSWGESDETNFGGPDGIVEEALLRGVQKGRNMKGSIYVWASGNSGPDDNCNADGYISSIYTIAIASVSRGGYPASFGETCSAILASTYTDIVTTDLNRGCYKKFTGTSASAPIASAIYSLALQANKDLTWRDIQHLTVQTSSMTGLTTDDIVENGVGRKVSHYFGFGLMNAEKLINAARNWTLVSQQINCTTIETLRRLTTGASNVVISNINITNCGNKIEKLEHVIAHITFDCTRRGDVELILTSPKGTEAKLLTKRRHDNQQAISFNWKYMSVIFWGENPSGVWSLKMRVRNSASTGSLTSWKLIFYGTTDNPNANENRDMTTEFDFVNTSAMLTKNPNSTLVNVEGKDKKEPNKTSQILCIAGYAIGGVFAFTLLITGLYFILRKKKRKCVCPETIKS